MQEANAPFSLHRRWGWGQRRGPHPILRVQGMEAYDLYYLSRSMTFTTCLL